MARHKVQKVISLYLIKLCEKIRKVVVRTKVLSVGVDVLTEERNVAVALCYECLNLVYYVFLAAATLATSYVRNNTVCAKIITAIHN